jgi:hypothetical protein
MATYLHVLDGRIRIKVPAVKGEPLKAAEVERQVGALNSSIEVKANPTTGNVLVLFDPVSITKDRILDLFRDIGCLTREPGNTLASSTASSNHVGGDASGAVARRVIDIVLQVAIERLILALI